MTTRTAMQLLPFIAPAQAQKHVTYNSALKLLDVLVQTSASSRFLTAPPVGAVAGDSYIVGTGATGDWLAQDRNLAVYNGAFWEFYVPQTGWRVWVEAEGTEAVYSGTDWTTSADRTERVAALGISADADDTNRLTVASDASLFTNAGAGHQMKVNKATVGDTASLLFQTGFSGRAEMGTVGSDNFTLKVSPDGTTFLTGLTVEAATGKVVASHGINLVPGAGDPASPANGDVWYNSTTGKLRARQNGVSADMVVVSTDALTEGSANLYFTNARAIAAPLTGFAAAGARAAIIATDSVLGALQKTQKYHADLSPLAFSGAFADLTARPTSVAGYGITDGVDLAATQTITGAKTFSGTVAFSGAQTIIDSGLTLQDDVDTTKKAQFQLSTISTATTRTYTLPNSTGAVIVDTQGTTNLASTTGAATVNLATSVTTTGNTKTVNIGTSGASGATSNVNIGAAVAGVAGTLTINTPSVVLGSTVTAFTVSDSVFTMADNTDATKKAQFELSGLTTGTTRTLTLPDASGTLALNSVVTASANGLAPASGGGAVNFLRADGTWAAPAGGGGGGAYGGLTAIPAAIDAIDGLTPAADSLAYYTGASTAALTSLTTFGRSLIDDTDANAARTTLERQDFATRAAFVTWATGRTPATGLVMNAAGFSYRYIGSGTAISDLPGWLPFDEVYADHWLENATPGTTDMGAAILSALAYGAVCYLTGTSYATSQQLAWDNGALRGTESFKTIVIGLAASIAIGNAIIKPGRSSFVSDLTLKYNTLTGTETQYQRVGLDTRGLSLVLQRDSVVDRMIFDNCGTCISDFGGGEFSVTYGAIEIRAHSYRAVDIGGIDRTGSTWGNVYINGGATYAPEGGFCITGQGAGGFIGQLNVEHGAYSGYPVRIEGAQGLQIASLHIEGVDCTTASMGYVGLDSSSVSIGSLNVLNTRMTTNNTAVVRLAKAGYQSLAITSPLTNASATSTLQIGKLHIKGIADPNTSIYPSYPSGRRGVRNCSGFAVFLRDTSYTDANWLVDCEDYLYGLYAPQAADLSFVATPDSTAGGSIQFPRFVTRRSIVDADWTMVDDGDPSKKLKFNLASIATATSRTVSWPNSTGTVLVSGDAAPSLGNITAAVTVNIAAAATLTATTKVTNIGTGGVAGSTSNINIGSATGGTLTISSPSLAFTASGGGTTNFLRADGSWAAPASSGVADGDKGDVIVSGTGAVWSLDYTAVNATIAPVFANVTAKPTTISGYGITDGVTLTGTQTLTNKSLSWAQVTATPTTISGYGITDAVALTGTQTVGGAKTFSAPLILTGQASDPSSPANGTIWYNSTTNQLRAQSGGVVQNIDGQESLPWLTPITGEYMLTTSGAGGNATGTLAGAAGRIDLFPFTARADTVVTGVAVNVTTLVASALVKVVVYDSDVNGRPANLVIETADMDAGTAGVRTVAASFTMRQGRTYWIGTRHSSTATLSTWVVTATPDINGGSPVTTARKLVRRTLAYATAATSTWGWTSSEVNAAAATAVWLKV